MNSINQSTQIPWQEIFASTLLHSLWQGALIVISLWLIKNLIQKNSVYHYRLSLTALICVILFSIGTFVYLWNQNSTGFNSESFIAEVLSRPDVLHWFNLVWFMGSMMFFVRFLMSHYYLKKLIRTSKEIKDGHWLNIFQKISKYYSIKQPVNLLRSDHACSAFLTGFIKPAIIIPTSWVNQLSYKEAECILAHELSHVFNRDHWVNLFMQIAEIIFYFNPAIHILISHIKLERELKADSSACNYMKEPLVYAKLILKIEETALDSVPAISIGFFQQRKQLKRRIESVLSIKGGRREFTSSFSYLSLLAGLVLFGIVTKKDELINPSANSVCKIPTIEKQIDLGNPVKPITKVAVNSKNHKKLNLQKSKSSVKPESGLAIEKMHNETGTGEMETPEFIDEENIMTFHETLEESILQKIEREIRQEKNNRTTIIYEISKSKIDSNKALNSGNWMLPRQVKCYAPVETKTYIIIKTRNASGYEPEMDWNKPGRIRPR